MIFNTHKKKKKKTLNSWGALGIIFVTQAINYYVSIYYINIKLGLIHYTNLP